MLKRRSNEDILNFIEELPGGNPTQYAKLLNTTSIRINALMNTKAGKKLARADKVVASERGHIPTWSFTDRRGCLKGGDINIKKLPSFISDLLLKIHPEYREDALSFFRNALNQTANHSSIEDQMSYAFEQTKDHTDEIINRGEMLAQRDAEITRFDRILNQARSMAEILENRSEQTSEPEAEMV